MEESIIYTTPNGQYWIVPVISEITKKPYYYFLCRKSEDPVITELFKQSEKLEELLRWLRLNKIISSDEMNHQIKNLCSEEDMDV
jgi:hypothetical protein